MKNPSETEDLEKEVLIKSTILKLLPRNIRGFVCAIVVINMVDKLLYLNVILIVNKVEVCLW